MQKILVTSDLSDRSRPAVARAVELAVACDAALVVLSVINQDVPGDLARALELGAAALLSEQVEADLDGRAVPFEVRIETGDPLALIPDIAVQVETDLLVVGTHRRRAFLDQVRETTVEHIIRSSRVPVLLVAEPVAAPYATVLAGTAYSKTCTSLVHMIHRVAPEAAVTYFHAHAVSFEREATQEFETWRAVYGLPKTLPVPVLFEGTPQDAVETLAETVPFDLLAIGGHTRSDGGRYFTGRFTAGLIRNPPCDLLIAK